MRHSSSSLQALWSPTGDPWCSSRGEAPWILPITSVSRLNIYSQDGQLISAAHCSGQLTSAAHCLPVCSPTFSSSIQGAGWHSAKYQMQTWLDLRTYLCHPQCQLQHKHTEVLRACHLLPMQGGFHKEASLQSVLPSHRKVGWSPRKAPFLWKFVNFPDDSHTMRCRRC